MSDLQTVVSQLDKIVYKGRNTIKGVRSLIYTEKAIRLYGSYLMEMAKVGGILNQQMRSVRQCLIWTTIYFILLKR